MQATSASAFVAPFDKKKEGSLMESQPVSEVEYLQLRTEFMKAVEKRSNVRDGEVQLDYYSGDITKKPGSTKPVFESRIGLTTTGGEDAHGAVLYHPGRNELIIREKLYARILHTLTDGLRSHEHVEVRPAAEKRIVIDASLTRENYELCLQAAIRAQHPYRDFDFRDVLFRERTRKAHLHAGEAH